MIAGFAATSPAVFETTADPVTVDAAQVARLIEAAKAAPQGRARLLLHPGREDGLHEMVIALPPDSCDHPHINDRSGKSFLALSGRFAVLRFSDDGGHCAATILSPCGTLMLRLRAPVWHTIVPLEGNVVFLETIAGPFTGNRFAPWFPADGPARADAVARLRTIARAAA